MNRRIKSCCSQLLHKACFCFLITVCFLFLGSGCHSSNTPTVKTVRIGLAMYSQNDTFISAVVQEMEQLAREKESVSNLKINLNLADGQSNQTVQLEQIDRFLDSGCDVLCVNIVDRTAAAVLIDKAASRDVPVIFFNRQPVQEDLQRWEKVYYVGPKGEESGIYQGEIILESWRKDQSDIDKNGDGTIQYVMLEGEPGHQDAMLRSEYAIKPLLKANIPLEKLDSDTANWSRSQAAAKMKLWCEIFGEKIEVVIANNDDMALGAIDAMKEAGIDPLPAVVGVDATEPAIEALRKKELLGTVQNAPEMPGVLLELALRLSDPESSLEKMQIEEGHYIWLPYYKITRETLIQQEIEGF